MIVRWGQCGTGWSVITRVCVPPRGEGGGPPMGPGPSRGFDTFGPRDQPVRSDRKRGGGIKGALSNAQMRFLNNCGFFRMFRRGRAEWAVGGGRVWGSVLPNLYYLLKPVWKTHIYILLN